MSGSGGSDRGSYVIPKKIPQCFCISKFYLSSGKYPNWAVLFSLLSVFASANFIYLLENTQIGLCCFHYPKKIPASFIDPKKIPFGQNVRPKKILRTPSLPPPPQALKYVSGAPGMTIGQKHWLMMTIRVAND